MTKIRDLVTIHSGYAKFVNLIQTFTDPTSNRGRMEQYMPIKSHRQAFMRLTRALYPLDNRVYLLTGSYGTGKSHLCLMLANYLSLKTSDPEMVAFFNNWSQREADEAEKLRNLRGEGRYLVALAEYGSGDDFDSTVLKAIQAAVEREGLQETWLDTHYQEATRQLDNWQERQSRGGPSGVFADFQHELSTRYPGWDLAALKQDLATFGQEALDIFRELYRTAVGNEFSYNKDNLVSILQDFLANPKFKAHYKGLIIIADEFGNLLDRGNIRIDVFQRFAEMCQHGVEGSQLIFIGTGHKPFRAYSAGGLSSADFSVAADRVTEVPLESEELELIIAAIVVPNKSHPVWLSDVASNAGMFNRFALQATRFGLFKHLKGPELRNRVVENIYPMHPMATHCLIEMSTEISSNARSVFAFFSGGVDTEAVPGSYPWYLQNTGVKTNDRLNLYSADQLTQYFEKELRPENSQVREAIRQHIRNYRASLAEVEKIAQTQLDGMLDPLVEQILKLILVYEISKIAPTEESLAFGLYYETPAEKSRLNNVLTNQLVSKQVLFRSATGIYEFRPSQATDFESLIEQYKADASNYPKDLAHEVTTLVSLGRGEEWLVARNYNQPYDEDKRLKRLFVRAGDLSASYPVKQLGQEVNFFAYQTYQLESETEWKSRYEGVAVYVLCETDEEVARAKRTVEANQSQRVLVGIPRQPIPIQEAVMNLRAAFHIRDTENLDSFSLLDRSRLQEDIIGDERLGTGFAGMFAKTRQRYLAAKELVWYGRNKEVLIAQPQSEYEPADELMGRLYEKRNTVPHSFLNQVHVTRFGPGKDVPLSDAVSSLLRTHQPVEIDHSVGANRGEIRYLKNVLADSGALQQMGAAQGNVARYQVVSSADKFRTKLPGLAAMLDTVSGLSRGQTLSVRKLLAECAGVPYGQGPFALSLFLAFTIRTFGDELRLQLQPGAIGYASLNDPNLIISLVNHEHPNAILERREIDQATRKLINETYNLFAAEPGAAGQTHTINEAHSALRDWWNRLPNLAKIEELYATDSSSGQLVKLLRNSIDGNPYRLLLEQLQTVYGYSDEAMISDESLTKIITELKQNKVEIEDNPRSFKETLLKRLIAPFNPVSNLYGDYQAAIESWYHNLDPGQQDEYASWHNHTSHAVIRRLRTITNLETTFFDQLPADAGFGLGKADAWHHDRSQEYVQRLTEAVEHIAKNRIKVPQPIWEVRGVGHKLTETVTGAQISFRRGVVLDVRSPETGISVLLTDNNTDPRTAQQREVVTDKYELSVNRGRIVQMVSQSQDGSFGQVINLSFINEDTKYEISPISQQKLLEREYKFVYPVDKEALEVVLLSLMREAIKNNLVDEEQARQMLRELAEKLKGSY